jgi:predicted transcriptional regulator of viral defense system
MIMTGEMIVDTMEFYEQPRLKLARDAKKGKYIRLKRDLYCTDPEMSKMALAQSIYGPSYVSFDYALSYYGLIPEHAYNVSSATFKKRKDKRFVTDICSFYYSDVPAAAYPHSVELLRIDDVGVRIATPEKALCDKLYKLPPATGTADFEDLLFEFLRVFDDSLYELEAKEVRDLSKLYKCRNVTLLAEMMGRYHADDTRISD